jgi:hypothetical protein
MHKSNFGATWSEVLPVLTLVWSGTLLADAPTDEGGVGPPPTTNTPAAERKHRLPFMAEEAIQRGHELPLPYGGALVLTVLDDRRIDVSDVRIGLRNSPQSVSQFVDLGSTSEVFNANAKFDAWLLPFMNVYALVGYVHNTSTTQAHIAVPLPGPIPGTREYDKVVETELEGMIGGIGMTLAGGYQNFYLVLDMNYVQTDLGFDDEFQALIASVRTGWNGRLGELPLQIWAGVGNWDTAATAKGHVDLEGIGRLVFEADQEPHTPWIYDVGANIEFSKSFQLFVDVGADFDGALVFVVGPTYRF